MGSSLFPIQCNFRTQFQGLSEWVKLGLITQAMRHRALKWAEFVFLIIYLRFDLWSYVDWLVRHQYIITAKERMCFACLTWLYGLFVRTFISRINAYAGCSRPTLNFIERFDLGCSIPSLRSHFTSCQLGASIVCIQIMLNFLAWMWT